MKWSQTLLESTTKHTLNLYNLTPRGSLSGQDNGSSLFWN